MNNKNPRKSSAKQPMKKKGGKQPAPQPPPQQQQSAKVNNAQQKNETKSKVNNNNNAGKKKPIVAEPVSKKESVVEVPQPKRVTEEPKKLERSNSFIGTLSKIYNKLSDSIENLTKIAKEPETTSSITSLPFKFQRSLTLNSFQLKKSYRKSLLENSRLEKLSEEKISEGKTPSTPPKSPSPPPVQLRSRSPTNYRQTMPAGNFDCVDFTKEPPPQLKRSDSFISLIKRKISFNDMKAVPLSQPAAPSGTNLNRNWAMSLQNLQQIDNMVSYEDLSFVDYDKFNQYEKQIDKILARRLKSMTSDHVSNNKNRRDKETASDAVVVRRRPKKKITNVLDADINRNLDREKNLYRQSIDSNKLRLLSSINLDSHRWSQVVVSNDPMEWLSLENKQMPLTDEILLNDAAITASSNSLRRPSITSLQRKCHSYENLSTKFNIIVGDDEPNMLKSKSLTHLDRIQPQINVSSSDNIPVKNVNGSENVATNGQPVATAVERKMSATTVMTSKFTAHPSDINCTTNDSSTTNLYSNVNSHATTTTTAIDSPIISSTTRIKPKSSSFLHRDYNRKPILARSQVSSSEFFTVCFDTENGFKEKDGILIAATKGIALGDSLRQALEQRGLSSSQITVIDYGMKNSNELGIPQYFGPLDENVDIGILAGHSLLVTDRENVTKKSGHYVLKKANSVGYRTTTRLLSSVSAEECEPSDTTKTTKQTKQRLWSLQLFGVKNPQQNLLCELLNAFTKNGVPKSKSSYLNSSDDYTDEALQALLKFPTSWRDFVEACDISESDTKIQSAIWELVTTEVDYIHAIQTVTDLFLSCLEAIQSENLLKDIDQHKLFSNIRDIVDANLKLWTLYLYPMVKHSTITGHLMCIDFFQQGFTNFACIFEPYTKYCAEQVLCQNYCKDLNRNNGLFTSYLAWCESQKECNRLRLADILVRPMQRLTKYNLLLSAIRKHIQEENEAEIMDLMIHSVDEFVCSVNSHLTTRQESERLKGIMARIESYDVVDSNNESLEKLIKQYSQMFDLCAPIKGCVMNQGRYLFLEGDMKYKDNVTKMDVHCFLLTDMLLICKQTAKKAHGNLKVIRQPFMTDRLVIKLKEKENALHCVYLNDFNMVIAGFVLQCNEAKNWYDGITKARHIYVKLKQGTFGIDAQGHSVRVSLQQQQHSLTTDNISIRKSPLGSSIVSSLNNSHSGSVELNESKTVSVDFDKTNSISSDEGSYNLHKVPIGVVTGGNRKLRQTSSNSLTVQSFSTHLNQSMPNLTSSPYHTNSNNNTLLVPGAQKSHSAHSSHSTNLLSPSQRGISYPPPSPTRATLRRGFAFSTSINNSKNPPLVKSRNVTSQSFNYPQQISAAAAGTALQQIPPTSQIQVVYEQSQTSSKTDATSSTNRPDIENARSET